MGHEVFISYSKGDKVVADAVCHHLESRQISCWIAPRDVAPGADWTDSIAEAISKAGILLVVFSEECAESRHVKSEVRAAFDQGKILVPLRVSQVMPSAGFDHLLGTSHWIDAFPEPLEHYFGEVASVIAGIQGREPVPPISVPEGSDGGTKEGGGKRNSGRLGLFAGLVASVLLAGFGVRTIFFPPGPANDDAARSTEGEESFRFAYVVSNWDYPANPAMQLRGARADGHAVSAALREQGYRCILKENLGREALGRLGADLSELEREGGTFVLYYSGQSFELDGETYLIPSDLPTLSGNLETEDCVPLSLLLRVPGGAEVHVLYSAQRGAIAYDQAPGRETSPFASSFVDELPYAGDPVAFARRVTERVEQISGGAQRPELALDPAVSRRGQEAGERSPPVRRFVYFDGCRTPPSGKSVDR